MQKLYRKCLSDKACLILWPMSCNPRPLLSCSKTGNKKRATCFATLLQHELNTNSDIEHFTTHVQTCIAKTRSQGFVGGNTRDIAIQLVLQQCCKKLHVFCYPFSRTFNFQCTSTYPTTFQSERLKLLYFHSLSCQ